MYLPYKLVHARRMDHFLGGLGVLILKNGPQDRIMFLQFAIEVCRIASIESEFLSRIMNSMSPDAMSALCQEATERIELDGVVSSAKILTLADESCADVMLYACLAWMYNLNYALSRIAPRRYFPGEEMALVANTIFHCMNETDIDFNEKSNRNLLKLAIVQESDVDPLRQS